MGVSNDSWDPPLLGGLGEFDLGEDGVFGVAGAFGVTGALGVGGVFGVTGVFGLEGMLGLTGKSGVAGGIVTVPVAAKIKMAACIIEIIGIL
jgi:hypothetical protein